MTDQDTFAMPDAGRTGKGASGPGGPYCPQSSVPVRNVPAGDAAPADGSLVPPRERIPLGK
jgi:hypothetical protein